MNELVETNKLLKKAVQGMYKKLTYVQKQNPRKFPKHKGNFNKIRKSSQIC